MKLQSQSYLKTFKKLAVVIITGSVLAFAGCGGGGGGTSMPVPPPITGTVTVLYSFAGGATDGYYPVGNLIQASDGNLYGMTQQGGAGGFGIAFKVTPAGTESVLYPFAGPTADGGNPWSSLIQASDGNFYGMTNAGGTSNLGVIFRITPAGAITVLHSFAGATTDGSTPYGDLIQASDGNFYGMTSLGGANDKGEVFKMTSAGVMTVVHSFAGGATDGASPYGTLIQANDGNFYGMTTNGGANNQGAVFKITTGGTVTVLHSFSGGTADGSSPEGSLIQASDGNLYGMTIVGGTSNLGTVFKITTTGTFTLLHSFAGGTADGSQPQLGSLIQANDGNLYGMTYYGGVNNKGTVFRITTAGAETVLHSFAGGATDGAGPYGSLIQASDGNLYGMTMMGGNNIGTVIKIQ